MGSHPLLRPADGFIWGNFATGQRNLACTQSGDGSFAKNDFQYVSPGLFAYQCQWKVLHREGRADAAFTCDGVREHIADNAQPILQQAFKNVKITTLHGMTMMTGLGLGCKKHSLSLSSVC